MTKQRVLLVEDHPLMRKGIKDLIQESQDYTVAFEASSYKEAVQMIQGNEFDVALLDISLPDGSGLDLISIVKVAHPFADIVMMTMHKEEPYLAKAVSLGASGYVVKDMAPERLLETLKAVSAGEKRFHSSKQEGIKPTIRSLDSGPLLSKREAQVIELLQRGLTLTEVASRLEISVKTVFTYKTRLYKKLGLEGEKI